MSTFCDMWLWDVQFPGELNIPPSPWDCFVHTHTQIYKNFLDFYSGCYQGNGKISLH